MNCKEYENLITDYLEDKVSPGQRAQIESHFSECERCRALSDHERSVMEQLNVLPVFPCPDEIIDQVMETISERRVSLLERIRSRFETRPFLRYGFASLAGSVIIIVLAMLLFIHNQNKQTVERYEFTAEEILQAKIEAKLALKYFAVYSSNTETVLDKIKIVEPVVKPIELNLKKTLNMIPYI